MFGFRFGRKIIEGDRGEPIPEDHDGLPDTGNPAGLCPRCGKQSSFTSLGSIPLTFDGGYVSQHNGERTPTFSEQATVFICHNCKQGVSVLEEELVGGKLRREQVGGGVVSWRGFNWWPLPNAKMHRAVPEQISSALSEAVRCLSANCPRAAAVMARRTLEAIAIEKGAGKDGDQLHKRLAEMANRGLLQPVLAEWSREVRLVGNLGAHFDPMETVTHEDAQQLIDFIKSLTDYLYVLPHQLEARRQPKPTA